MTQITPTPSGAAFPLLRHDPDKLRRAIRARGLTQHDVADRMGISDVRVSEWIHGRKNIRNPDLLNLAELLHVPPSYLDPDLAELDQHDTQSRDLSGDPFAIPANRIGCQDSSEDSAA